MGFKRDDGTLEDTCLNKVKPGEPIFVLRAQDKLAPALVFLWAAMAELHGCPYEKADEAKGLAVDMRIWAVDHGSKFPD